MTPSLDPRLDSFERRLHELEAELAELRALAANGHAAEISTAPVAAAVAEPVEPVEAGEPDQLEFDVPWWALQRLERDDFRGLFRDIERARRLAVSRRDIDALLTLNKVAKLAEARAPVGVDARAAELGQAIRQNIRFLGRKLGVEVDEAALVRNGKPQQAVEPRVGEALSEANELEALRSVPRPGRPRSRRQPRRQRRSTQTAGTTAPASHLASGDRLRRSLRSEGARDHRRIVTCCSASSSSSSWP